MRRYLTLLEGGRPDSCGWDRCEEDPAYGVELVDHHGHGLLCRTHARTLDIGKVERLWSWRPGAQ